MSHVSSFSFSIYFSSSPLPSSPFLSASGFHCHLHSLHFLCQYLSSAFTHTVYSLIGIPNSLFFRPLPPLPFFFSYLFAWLKFCPPPLKLALSPPLLCLPTHYNPTFHGNVCLLFPSFEDFFFFNSSSKKVPAAQIIPF